MSEQIVICNCRDCQKEMELIQQERWNGGFLTLATCKNPACLLRNVTLSIPEYVSKTDAQFEAYREMNRTRRAGLHVVVSAVEGQGV